MKRMVEGRTITLTRGDITDTESGAIVNAANQHLAGGGGVDGAIHRAGGPSIMAECRRIGGCAPGDAVATGAGDLKANHVIHAVAPIWRGGHEREAELLSSAYRRSLETAERLGESAITFPSLGTGAYGYPIDQAARIALQTVVDYLGGQTRVEEVTFVLFSERDLETYRHALEELE